MHVYELESDLLGTMLFSTLEKAKAKALWCVREWDKRYVLVSSDVDECIKEVEGWSEDNPERYEDMLVWDLGDVATIRTVEVW